MTTNATTTTPVNIPVPVEQLTAEQFRAAMPRGVSITVTPDLVNHINNLIQDEQLQQSFRDNLLSYATVLKEGRFKTESYVAAVEYVSRKLMGDSNEVAYSKVFPARYNKLLMDNRTPKEISAYVSAFHKSKLVGLIMAQTMTPVWVYNQAAVQEAINTQVDLMRDPKVSPMVKTQAANSLLTHLKQPEKAKVELDISVSDQSPLDDLRKAMEEFAKAQQDSINAGNSDVSDVAGSRIARRPTDIEGEVV